MEGYLKSKMKSWKHIFKMAVRPGGEVPLDTLYSMYGKKHNIAEEDFVEWLKNVKLKDKLDDWLIIEKNGEYIAEHPDIKQAKENDFVTNSKGEVVARQMTVSDVLNLSVRKARDVIPGIMDAKLLKYAIIEARPLPNKETLIRILEKRVQELSLNPT